MLRKFLIAGLFLLLASFSLFAQDSDDDWFWNKPITQIEFEGLSSVKKSDINGIISSYIDRPFTEEVYGELLDRLYALEYFEDIVPYAKHNPKNENQVLLVFQVQELPVIDDIDFTGNRKIRNSELREKIKIKSGDVFSESRILMAERAIKNFYIQKGYTKAQVSHSVVDVKNEKSITFHIKEGNNTVIKKISISGNTLFSERMIKGKFQLKEQGFLRDGAYQSSLLEQDKKAIVNYYKERGYIDAGIIDVKIDTVDNEEKQQNEMYITYYIQEGAQYIYSGITIIGNEVFSVKELLSDEKLKAGNVYDETKFQNTIMAIATKYMNNGYMSVNINPIPKKDSEHHEISYTLSINENNRSHVENIIIKGNERTKEKVIRREIALEEGDVYSQDKIISAYRNLMNLRYFSNVLPEPQQGSEKDLVDIVFNVEEQSTTSLQFGMTFAESVDPTSIPISLFAKWENSNLFGDGKAISGSLDLSTSTQALEFSYSQNWLGNLPIQFSQSLSISHNSAVSLMNMWGPNLSLNQYDYYMNYNSFSASLGSSISKRWTYDYAIISGGIGLSNSLNNNLYDPSIYVPVDSSVSKNNNRWGLTNTIFGSVSVDNRDINYSPSKGWFVSERLSWTGLIPGVEKDFYLKSDTKLEGYFTICDVPLFNEKWNLKLVFAAYTGFTGIFPLTGTTVSDGSKLYVDGMFNARGWTDVYKKTKGLAMFSNHVEIQMPLVPNIVGLSAFADACAVKPTVADMFTNLSIDDWYCSVGPGIKLLLPQFPIQFLFAFRYTSKGWDANPFQFVLSFNVVNR